MGLLGSYLLVPNENLYSSFFLTGGESKITSFHYQDNKWIKKKTCKLIM